MSATAIDIYDFETNVAETIATAFSVANMNYGTLKTPPNFQKPRPRSEIIFRPGAAVSPNRIDTFNFGTQHAQRYIAAYHGSLEVTNLTDASTAGKEIHSAYRSQVRAILELDPLRFAVNSSTSPYAIDWIVPAGTTDTFKTGEGYEMSKLTYDITFSFKRNAFYQYRQGLTPPET